MSNLDERQNDAGMSNLEGRQKDAGMSNLEGRQKDAGMSNLEGRQKDASMSNLDGRQRDASMPKSESTIQKLFDWYNGMGNLMDGIKSAREIDRKLHQARENYINVKATRQKQNEPTPVVTAQDIKDEMYR